ncbi:MAG TPA: IS5/IS1182 family transposase, partial [Beutenbergiaceae bacterium]|nr:IS5/IS1182 family transposase [Beutenbergiaceae bacterium]
MSRTELLTDAQWELIEPLLPSSDGRRGRPF